MYLLVVTIICCCSALAHVANTEEHITFLDIVHGDQDVRCPDQYTKIETNLKHGVPNSDFMYLCFKKEEPERRPLQSIVVISGQRPQTESDCPDGYRFDPINLNEGTNSSTAIHFCYLRGMEGPWITSINFVVSDTAIPKPSHDYHKGLCRSEDLNRGAGGSYVYLCYGFDVIVRSELSNVIYDFGRAVTSFTNGRTVAHVLFHNLEHTSSQPTVLSGSYAYTTSSEWAASSDNSKTMFSGLPLTVVAATPILRISGWSPSDMETYKMTFGEAISSNRTADYSLPCTAPANTDFEDFECRGTYKQGTIQVPFNATHTTWYADGGYSAENVTNYIYRGVSEALLEVFQNAKKSEKH